MVVVVVVGDEEVIEETESIKRKQSKEVEVEEEKAMVFCVRLRNFF